MDSVELKMSYIIEIYILEFSSERKDLPRKPSILAKRLLWHKIISFSGLVGPMIKCNNHRY
jgi:hypothetical protein